ncbi:MAG: acyl dehydratase [Leptospiraceae bacterium]|nr:hypothetical protein [Leptospiraceae bacterium]MCP5494776.1 acyl dehydratase [Leptospiraceae bacterium]
MSTQHISGPYFEDFSVGQVFDFAPSITITSGYAAIHQAIFADGLRLPLDINLSRGVTGTGKLLANPSLICNIAIGQTTYASQRVKGNLFYRGLMFYKPVFIGDTLRTTTKVVALKQNAIKPGRPASGMVVLEMQVKNQANETVMHFWRCPMIPCKDENANTGHSDSFDTIPSTIDVNKVIELVPKSWNLNFFKMKNPGTHFKEVSEGTTFVVENRDTITSAPELVRMTLNAATTHTDAVSSVYKKRLVYGGHTISMAASHIVRAIPNFVTILAWRSCDHTAPVFEEDILRTEVTVDAKHSLGSDSESGLVELHVVVYAERGGEAPEQGKDIKVLDWHLIGLMA